MTKGILLRDIINFINDDIVVVWGNPEGVLVKHLKDPLHVDEFTLDWINVTNANKQIIAEASKAQALIVDTSVKYTDMLKNQKKVIIQVKNPKLVIATIANEFFVEKVKPDILRSAVIHREAVIGKNVYIGPNVVIGKSKIGSNVIIHGNNYIYDNCIIEDNVEIHAGAIIGNEAHNFEKDNHGNMIAFPHLGRVVINENVVIGANTCISRGVLGDTIIGFSTKIAQLVFIGSNSVIGDNCAIRPNVMTSGSVIVGNNTILAPSVTIRNQIRIGESCMIGMGSVVIRNVPDNETWIGNPARKMRKK